MNSTGRIVRRSTSTPTITSVTIPDGVTSIGDYAFCGCSRLTSVSITGSMVLEPTLATITRKAKAHRTAWPPRRFNDRGRVLTWC